ncbi:MAG: DNA methyltransferase, partial [bacterium]
MTKESAKKEIVKLIKDYELHRNEYKQKGYDEHQFCMRILNRFFNALGWDVENNQVKSEFYCDTIFQYKLKNEKTTKFPDYAFGFPAKNNAIFFAEAKTPSTIIHTDKDAALQIRRYGKSGGLAISVVTNFEEFAVYDCTIKANESDSPRVGRLEYFTYQQYSEKFDLLWQLFSKEGIEQGYHDKYIKTDTKKKGSVTLDKDFVGTLDSWRKYLATSISHNNMKLTNDEINFAVQQTVDRIIFLRFCEDRNVEKFETLLGVIKKGDYYKNLYEVFKNADIKYNSGLFDFEKDVISHKIKVDNKIIRNIIEELYRPKSEYEFGVMPVEILGNAYEEFLGKVIRVTPGHIVKIDIAKKPEVQKAGGVFYTPQYIVNYIVEHTVGKLINGKTPEQISKIKIVDPACGSGSFLLGAYIYLLRYHTDYYWKKEFHKKREKNNLITPEGRLTVTEKKRILQNNLFGVDIDPNAVEVTKLSLLLKTMEGETEASIGLQLRFDKKGVLPDLDLNIQCGNSLISPDFFDEQ